MNSSPNDFDQESVPLTGELYGKALFADEVVGVKLQREYVKSGVDVFGQGRAGPFL